MPNTLSDAKASIERFTEEALCCAACELGFAALLTAFAVLLAVEEAVLTTSRVDDLIEGFVPAMKSKNRWFHSPVATPTDQVIAGALVELRNALAHELSMPTGIKMVNTASQAATAQQQWPGSHVVSVVEFVEGVRTTALAIVAANPNAVMDSSQAGRLQRGSISMPRSPAKQEDLFDKTSGSSST
jgi:hypothetical protein